VEKPKGKRPLGNPRIAWKNNIKMDLNPLNAELNPICHLLVLLRAHPILYISRIRVKVRGWKGLKCVYPV
jgi:hypothetical protein